MTEFWTFMKEHEREIRHFITDVYVVFNERYSNNMNLDCSGWWSTICDQFWSSYLSWADDNCEGWDKTKSETI